VKNIDIKRREHLYLSEIKSHRRNLVTKFNLAETIRLHRLGCFVYVQRMEENKIPKECCICIWNQQDQEKDGKIK
jgi:hypothetical protein